MAKLLNRGQFFGRVTWSFNLAFLTLFLGFNAIFSFFIKSFLQNFYTYLLLSLPIII